MNTTAIIIEDEQLTANRLKSIIEELTDIEILTHLKSVKTAKQWFLNNSCPDLIFLDIQLSDGTGFNILDDLLEFPYIIFTTAFDQYTLDAFKHNSVDYLLKPIKPKELVRAVSKYDKIRHAHAQERSIDQLRHQLEKKYKSRFLFKSGSKFQQVTVDGIAYFYSHDGLNFARCKTGEAFIADSTLDELEALLDPKIFFRINRSMLVKAENIHEIHTYFNGRLLLDLNPAFEYRDVIVSREKVKAFKGWLDA